MTIRGICPLSRIQNRKLRESAIDEKRQCLGEVTGRSRVSFRVGPPSLLRFASFSDPLHDGIVLEQSLAKMSYNVIVIIHHYTKWLPDDETRPYDDVAPSGAAVSFRHLAQHRQWYLSHHTHKRPYLERLQRHADEILVEESANKEDSHRRHIFTIPHLHYWNIQMPHSPAMHWHVPSSPERIDIVGVPPIAVKIPICKV